MTLSTQRPTGPPTIEDAERHRRELTAYCYRMLASPFDAEDAVQETMVRAWRASERFEGRSSVRSWLYRIATNVCLDMLRAGNRRAMPMELGPSRPAAEEELRHVLPDGSWVSPIADERILPPHADPAEVAQARDSVRLAFVTALQHLPPRQRAALILCDVLRWRAAEAADLLDTTVAGVNSALQRARAALAGLRDDEPTDGAGTARGADSAGAARAADSAGAARAADSAGAALDAEQRQLLARYVDAFERYDIDELVTLLQADAVQSMPPFTLWLRGRADIASFMLTLGIGCRGSRLLPTAANGCPAFAQYHRTAEGYRPWALQVLQPRDGQIAAVHYFLNAGPLFELFGLPTELSAD